jgi:hypothetical protein
MAHELRVPVHRLDARLFTDDGVVHDVTLFLPAGAGVEHLLDGSEPFVPVSEEGRVRIFARAALAAVSVRRDPEGEPPIDAHDFLTETRALTVRLRGGEALSGTLRHGSVHGKSRTADLLNESGASFTLDGEGCTYRVAKAHILCVDEV